MMTMLAKLAKLSVLVFTLTTMFGAGLGVTWREIVKPLGNTSLVVRALVANFVLVPLLALGIPRLFRLEAPLAAGLLILGITAGAPVIPKLTRLAKADVALSLALMVLTLVVTIAYSPLVLPLLLANVEIDPVDIARPQILWVLTPLALGLLIRARYPDAAAALQPQMNQASTFSIVMMAVLILPLTYDDLLAAVGTGAFLAAAVFVVLSGLSGYLLGGRGLERRAVMGIATGQRNIAVAMLIASLNFDDPKVLAMIMIASLLMLILGLPFAGEVGRRLQGGPNR